VARDLALRGLKTLVVEKGRPGHGTTVNSTHLIHGGLRYLLYDRLTTHTTCWDSGHILRIARPLLSRLPILWPVYRGHRHGLATVETLLESYDRFQPMKGGLSHLRLSAGETLRLAPGLRPEGLIGSVSFDEWWVDPEALVRANLVSAHRAGAEVRIGVSAAGIERKEGAVMGAALVDADGRREVALAPVVVNAAGPWADRVAALADIMVDLRLQKGTHLVYEGTPPGLSPSAGFLLEAVDGFRYVFVIPRGGMTLVGPTDLPTDEDPDRLTSGPEEIRYLLASVRRYFPGLPERYDRAIVGARPILGQRGSAQVLSRDFEVFDHGTRDGLRGFFTVAGGKMSDFRLMAQEAGDAVSGFLGRPAPCRTTLETLEGEPAGPIPKHAFPSKSLKKFLRGRPALKKIHALGHLACAFLKHLLRRLAGLREATVEDFRRHYST
jgi:glycerol-3-phosphate dehydrogenase